ncbi:MAG: adenine phosphoribosyltransferase [Candidatus Sericytochromatia bacterium]|uniref:Adenine phosphoribosyltransferase n=1 Tax=Candidatus Tanganyikabacteria bacterium TaxID=2961651 RepID=A0A938BIJ7_9BACT|nr:adenine phosphoribosyltransferase [Candidatus Tanganyikabacteria bacterium]
MITAEQTALFKERIRDIPDFPKPGIVFKDITPLMKDQEVFRLAVEMIVARYRRESIDYIVGIESRGFIFGAPVSYGLHCGFIPVRKPGKLPFETRKQEYDLEYGTDALEMHVDAIEPGSRILIVDDLLATGGTVSATTDLVRASGGDVVAAAFLVELAFLNGRERVAAKGLDIFPLISF